MISYTTQRPRIRTGDLILYTHEAHETLYDMQVQAVEFATKSKFSHVAIAWVVGPRVMIFEAVVPRVQIFPLSHTGDFYHVAMSKKFSEEALNFCLCQVGEKVGYSKLEGVRALFGKNNPNDGITQCSEFCKNALAANGLSLPGRAVPGDIAMSLIDLGYKLEKVKNALP